MQAIPMPSFSELKEWFIAEGRELPWRGNPTPYQVWISEVMLQQTQALVVIPYFERWMARFPAIDLLASAPLEEVIKLWEGLGYYSRARYLHEAAKLITSQYGGELPQSEEELQKIKGLGPYTIGAIRSFAFHKKAAAVDGNVARVLSRFLLIEEEIDRSSTQKLLREKLLELLPDSEPWLIMEALIELGAQICAKKPRCARCPLQEECLAYQKGRELELPRRGKRPPTTQLKRTVFVILHKNEVLVRYEKEKKIMQGLYEFPYLEGEGVSAQEAFDLGLQFQRELPSVEHSFTRYRAELFPSVWSASERKEVEGCEWIEFAKLASLPFSSGHREILRAIR